MAINACLDHALIGPKTQGHLWALSPALWFVACSCLPCILECRLVILQRDALNL